MIKRLNLSGTVPIFCPCPSVRITTSFIPTVSAFAQYILSCSDAAGSPGPVQPSSPVPTLFSVSDSSLTGLFAVPLLFLLPPASGPLHLPSPSRWMPLPDHRLHFVCSAPICFRIVPSGQPCLTAWAGSGPSSPCSFS